MKSAAIVAGLLLLGAPAMCWAADANHPYSNIDRRVDAGNNTGDAQVEQLNQAQLNRTGQPVPYRAAQTQPYATRTQPYGAAIPAGAPGAVAAYPPVAYAAPAYPYAYYPPPPYVVVAPPYFRRPFYYPFWY